MSSSHVNFVQRIVYSVPTRFSVIQAFFAIQLVVRKQLEKDVDSNYFVLQITAVSVLIKADLSNWSSFRQTNGQLKVAVDPIVDDRSFAVVAPKNVLLIDRLWRSIDRSRQSTNFLERKNRLRSFSLCRKRRNQTLKCPISVF